MTSSNHDDFFIGYAARRTPSQRRFLVLCAGVLVVAAGALAFAVSSAQPPADPGVFEFGKLRDLEGQVMNRGGTWVLSNVAGRGEPLPVDHGPMLVVRQGKFGADDLLAPLAGRRVQVRGTLIHSPAGAMVELAEQPKALPGSEQPKALPGSEPAEALAERQPADQPVSHQTLQGEIVDSKCFLGVMKPGRGNSHRACAVRCISGGVPAALRTVQPDGSVRVYLLQGPDRVSLGDELLPHVGVPVRVRGHVSRQDDLWILETSLGHIQP
jgi:hypothetical protein